MEGGEVRLDFLLREQIAATHAAVTNRVLAAAAAGKLVIVGSGPLPRKCLAAVQSAGGNVPFLVEYEPRYWGTNIEGRTVVGLDEAARLAPPDALFVVAIWSPNHCYAETREWLRCFGIDNVLPAAALFWAMPDSLAPHYQLAPPFAYCEGVDSVAAVLDGLGDDVSRDQLLSHLRWRVTLDPVHVPQPDRRHMYFDPHLFDLAPDARIADIGAFDGDSLRTFLYWRAGRFGEYHAFEPDPISFGRLETYVSGLPAALQSRIFPRPLAVGAGPATLRFSMTGKAGSHVVEGDGVAVECCRLDDYFGSERVDYIKFDIEGSERDGLVGCWSLIERDRPVVAVAVYHRTEDIFELPLLLMAHTPGYRYALRSYDHDGIDLVFFAIPIERSR